MNCGISRSTLRKWWVRYLQGKCRCPKTSPNCKVFPEHEQLIAELRKKKLGHSWIQSELARLHDLSFSIATIHKALDRIKKPHLNRKRAFRKVVTRYSRPIPGDRVQMDVCKIGPSLYQYTAIDNCTRYKVLRLYSRRTASNTLDFLDAVLEEMPFAFQRIQTFRSREFFVTDFQQRLLDWSIKFRPIKLAFPHLNGKVERSQRTDLEEFYATVDFKATNLADLLSKWQHYYNWDRPHGSLGGKTPIERLTELADKALLWKEFSAKFDPTKVRLQEQSYRAELALRILK